MEDNEKYTLLLIAQFLQEQGLKETVNCLLRESALSRNTLSKLSKENVMDEKLRDIINDRIAFNNSSVKNLLNGLQLDNVSDINKIDQTDNNNILDVDGFKPWNHGKYKIELIKQIDSSRDKDLIIGTKFCHNQKIKSAKNETSLVMTTSKKELLVYDSNLNYLQEKLHLSTIVKLFGNILDTGYQFTCTLNGCIQVYHNFANMNKPYEFKLHDRLITHLDFMNDNKSNCIYIVTYGLDQDLKISKLAFNKDVIEIGTIDCIKLPSHCTTLQLISMCGKPTIFLTRNDFTHIICYQLHMEENANKKQSYLRNIYNIALNNAQFTTHAFNILGGMILKNKYLVMITSHLPYMRVLMISIPQYDNNITGKSNEAPSGQTYYDKIMKNISTEIPNNQFSQPVIKYIDDINGIIIGNDSGLFAVDLVKEESWCMNDKITEYPKDDPRVKDIDYNFEHKKLVITFTNKIVKLWDIKVQIDR